MNEAVDLTNFHEERAKEQQRISRGCLNKKPYETANDAMNAIILKRQKNGAELHSYVCDYCGKYHITSDGSSRKTLKRQRKLRNKIVPNQNSEDM